MSLTSHYEKAIGDSENIIASVLAKARFWTLHAQLTLNDRQRKILNQMLDTGAGQFEGGLTTRKYATLVKVSTATAFREIDDLLKKKILKPRPGSGRSTSYDIKLCSIVR